MALAVRKDWRAIINDRGLIYPVLGLLSASLVIVGYKSVAGEALAAVSSFSVILVGFGGGLVLARIGNLGPFDGTFGPPWMENNLQDLIVRETARAIRFGRDLTIVAAREPNRRQTIDWNRYIRLCDRAIRCRDGWTLLIFPETTEAESVVALQRVRLEANRGFEAVLVTPQQGREDPYHLGDELQKLISLVGEPDTVTLQRDGKLSHHSLIP